jgi:predicted metal-dependent enzyme (double-stranded beta helix superfamily)
METPPNLNRLHQFVSELTGICHQETRGQRLIHQIKPRLQALLAHDDWLSPTLARPDPQRYQQYLLYADPQSRFSLVSFVWGPGQRTPVHDHQVWGVIGMLRGAELNQPYRLDNRGTPRPHGAPQRLNRGDVVSFLPEQGDIHQVSNALDNETSVSIHVYGGDIGATERHLWLEDGTRQPFVSGYSAQQEIH